MNDDVSIVSQLRYEEEKGYLQKYKHLRKDRNKTHLFSNQQTIIENAALGIVILDKHLNHLTVNPAFSGMTGFECKELNQNSKSPIYWPKDHIKEIKTEIQRLQQKGQLKMETYFQRKDTSLFPVSIVGSTFRGKDSQEKYILLIVDDITRRKKIERELTISQLLLLSLIQNLEKKVKERTQKIEQLLKQKDDFINQLGHDLKNPLGPLVNLTPVLLKNETDPCQKQMLEVIQRNINYINDTVTKTIELSQLDSDNINLNFEEIKLKDVAENIILKNNHLLKKNDVQVENELSSHLLCYADKVRIEEVFDNIITNAINHSQREGKISIKGSSTETTVTVSIKDRGIGMNKQQLDHVFDEFYKVDPARHDFRRSGLGTSIIKRIIEKHGGHIIIESEGIGKGTTVTFTIQKFASSKQDEKNQSETKKTSNQGDFK